MSFEHFDSTLCHQTRIIAKRWHNSAFTRAAARSSQTQTSHVTIILVSKERNNLVSSTIADPLMLGPPVFHEGQKGRSASPLSDDLNEPY